MPGAMADPGLQISSGIFLKVAQSALVCRPRELTVDSDRAVLEGRHWFLTLYKPATLENGALIQVRRCLHDGDPFGSTHSESGAGLH
jgi:hypothetical protein